MAVMTQSLVSLPVAEFNDRLASADPVPGGGSASAVAASLAASLVVMVARLSRDRPKYAAYTRTHERAIQEGERSRHRLMELADEDSSAYAQLSQALKDRREGNSAEPDASTRVQAAARTASEVPLVVVRECHRLIREIESLGGRSNLNAASDLDVAALLAQAAARGAGANVLVNLPQVGDERFAGETTAEVGAHLHEIEASVSRVNQQVLSGNLRSPESD